MDTHTIINLVASKLSGVPREDIERAVLESDVSFDTIRKIQTERYSWEFWDNESPINGCSRSELIELGMPIPAETTAFLIRDSRTSRVVCFQPFDPDLPNFQPMSEERACELAEQTKSKLVHQSTLSAIIKTIKLEIDHE